jgi:GNAT superfamily N-acetyltransferase
MYFTLIYKNLNNNQKNKISAFIKKNFNIALDNLLGLEPNTIIIIDCEDNIIKGCVCLLNNIILKNKLIQNNISLNYYNINKTDGLFLYNLCVDEKYRNKKIGNELINLCIDFIKTYKFDYVHCQSENDISKSLFLKNGFMEDTSFIGSNNKNIYIMTKYI